MMVLGGILLGGVVTFALMAYVGYLNKRRQEFGPNSKAVTAERVVAVIGKG